MSKFTHCFFRKMAILFCCFLTFHSSVFANTLDLDTHFAFKKLKLFQQKLQSTLQVKETISTQMQFFAPCPGGSGVIGGTVFGDFNYNGLNDQDANIAGVTVYLYACDTDGDETVVGNTVTDENGDYFFGSLTDGQQYRVEFIPPAFLGYNEGISGTDAGTSIQFVSAPSCGINASFAHPQDYCQDNPGVVASCYINGDPLPNSSEANGEDVVVYFNWEDSGNSDLPAHIASAGEAGATYGLGYDRDNQDVYASAFIKRFVGLGPLGIGGIYKIDIDDPDNPGFTEFLDVESIGIDVGSIPTNAGRGLPTALEDPSNDPDAYDKVATEGIGALSVSTDGKIWFVNLFDKSVYSIIIDSDDNPATAPTSGDVASFALPTNVCIGGTLRPFALKIFRDKVYVGAVCDASMSDGLDDLKAIVYELNGNTFTEVFRLDLDYDKGYAASANNCDNFPGWFPWLTNGDLPPTCDAGATYVYPQPVLTDIEFDIDGSMILGFMDRMGHQLGNKNWPLTGTSPLMTNNSGGDLLRVDYDNGTYTLENNGSAGGVTTGGAGNGEGPNGGEYYFQDYFAGPSDNFFPVPHAETSQGDLAFYAGAGEVATTALDPFSTLFNSGGVNWMNNSTGEVQLPGYVLYRTSSSSISSFSKANGLGAITVTCDNDAPAEVGGYVWEDINGNGVQDPCESPLVGINIGLYDNGGNLVSTVTTGVDGEYYFTDGSVSIDEEATYHLVAGTGGQFNTSTDRLNGLYFLSPNDIGGGQLPDRTDSDATLAGNQAGGAFTGLPSIEVSLTGAGFISHSLDFGFDRIDGPPVADISGTVWEDTNENGLLDPMEPGIQGVTVTLFDNATDLAVTSTTSGVDGSYSFSGIVAGDYYLIFDESTNTNGINDYNGTLQDAGDDTIDSDADTTNGQTDVFAFDPINGNLNTISAGFIIPSASIGGTVWDDVNQNGLLDNGEPGIGGVTVTLVDSNTDQTINTTTSASNGSYSFTNVLTGSYYLVFDETTNTAGVTNYIGTQQDAGNNAIDSDADPNTGETAVITFDPTAGSLDNVSAGFFVPTASIGGTVWNDNNADGINDNTEDGIAGVTVVLYDDDDNVIATVTSNTDGSYVFPSIPVGDYYIIFDPTTTGNNGYEFSPQDAGNDDDVDSDANPNTGQTDTFSFDPTNGAIDNISVGLTLPFGSVGNFVFKDCNQNGIQDTGDSGIADVLVTLTGTTTSNMAVSINTLTDINGNYLFSNVDAGTYTVNFALPNGLTGMQLTIKDAGNNDNVDSDANANTNTTDPFSLAGGDLLSIDAGFQDVQAPVFDNAPADETIACDNPNFTDPPTVTATDNYDDSVTVTFEEDAVGMGTGCQGGLMVTRTWTATDDCGNVAVHTQRVTTGDELDPVIINIPDLTVECDSNIIDVVKAVDDCDPNPDLEWTDIEVEGECPVNIIRQWTATDACGNVTTNTQKITLNDTTPPMIVFDNPLLDGVPNGGSVTVECDQADTISEDDAIITDNCDDDLIITFMEEAEDGVCQDDGYFRRRSLTWRAEDNCGNVTEVNVVVFIVDTTPPTISVPGNMTVDCNSIPPIPTPIVSDNCDNDLQIDFEEILLGDTCEAYKLVRKWFVIDDCLNITCGQQEIIVEVDNLEIQGVPDDITIECDEDRPDPANVTATNDCSPTNVDYQELFIDGDCIQKYVRVWTATDECGHEETGTQLITIVDTTDPEIEFVHPALVGLSNGDSLSFNCDEAIVFDENDAVATDNCQDPTLAFMEMQEIGDCSDGFLVRLECCWKADDGCGNNSELCIVVRIVDDKEPVLSGVPDDLTINQAFQDVPEPATVTAMDNCDDDVTIELVESQVANPDNCGYVLTRTWVATDDCGNIATDEQIITVNDVCDCPNILVSDVNIEPATCGQNNGAISVSVSIDPSLYNYVLIPNLGTANAAGNEVTNLPPGSYIMIIDLPSFPDCDEKLYFDIVEDNCTDIIQGTVAGTTEICIEEQFIDFQGVLTSTEIIQAGNANEVIAVSIDENCVTFEPDDIFTGIASQQIGVVHCFNNNPNQCDTTYFDITVEPAPRVCSMEIDMTEVQPLDCDGNLGTLKVSVINDAGNLTYTWLPNVSTSDEATDLVAGSYSVTVTDDANCTATTNFTLLSVQTIQLTDASVSLQNVSCANGNDGQIISTTGREYQISNANGNVGTTPLTDLVAGTYTVSASNADCSASISVEITEATELAATATTTAESCDGNDGSITITTTGGSGNYSYAWLDDVSDSAVANGLTASNTYAVTITDGNGCETIITDLQINNDCSACDLTLALSSQTNETCDKANGAIQLAATNGTGSISYTWQPMVSTANSAFGLSAGTYNITATDGENCEASISIIIENEQPQWSAIVNTTNETCAGNDGALSINVSGMGNYSYTWTPNISDQPSVTGLNSNQVFEVVIEDENGCTVTLSDLQVGLDCTQSTATINVDIPCGQNSAILCVNDLELLGDIQGLAVCQQPNNGILTVNSDTCVIYTPNTDYFGLDTVCLIASDANNLTDTTTFVIDVEECNIVVPCTDFIIENTASIVTNDCMAEGAFCLDLMLDDIFGMTITDNGSTYGNGLSGCMNDTTFAYNYFTIPEMGDNGPYTVSWNIDGTDFNGSFNTLNELIDLMNQWDPANNWTRNDNTGNLEGGSAMSMYGTLAVVQTNSAAFANLELNTNIDPQGSQLLLAQGLHELIFTNQFGCSDTINVEVDCIESETITDEILLGNSGMTCIDAFELQGTPQTPQVLCNSCGQINYELDGNCLRYDGILEGTSEIVLVLCDDLGYCDTTYLFVNVINDGLLPNPSIDVDSTDINEATTTDVLVNDTYTGLLRELNITTNPDHGEVTVNADLTITYTPNANFCGLDAYAYEICNQNGCAEVTVNLLVDCNTPNAVSGFSPNGDGINETFVIDNLDSYPNNELIIYNRFGNFVFKQKDYQNNWGGNYRNLDLPDGTYFYVLKYGEGASISGYVQVRR